MQKFKISEICWGSLDADAERNLLDIFVDPWPINLAFKDKYSIISGTKGSGKSAIRHVLLKKYSQKYIATSDISFDCIEFSPIIEGLNNVAYLTSVENLTLLKNYWMFCLMLQASDAYISEQKRPWSNLQKKLNRYLIKYSGAGTTFADKLLHIIDSSWKLLDQSTSHNQSAFPNGFPVDFISNLKRYPSKELHDICNILKLLLKNSNKKILVILDGFDEIRNHEALKSKIDIVFEALVLAVHQMVQPHSCSSDIVQIKALIPFDRYINIKLRDMDKIRENHIPITWNYNNLRYFLEKRIFSSLKEISSEELQCKFDILWDRIMPKELNNKCYSIQENTYDYILRHTMYRPRHLLLHLLCISEETNDFVNENNIRNAIQRSNRDIAEFFFREHEIDHPYLKEFISTRFRTNVLIYKEFKSIVSSIKTHLPIEDSVNVLYNIGVFGVIHDITDEHYRTHKNDEYIPPALHGNNRYRVEFSYKNSDAYITTRLTDSSLIALQPIFVDIIPSIEVDKNLIVG